jgi:hypothetical protein
MRRYHLDIGKRIASSGKARAMAGRKYGAIVQAKVKGAYFALSEQEQNIPGEVFGELMQKYAGKIDMVRRYWTRAFNANVTDVLVFECDDPADFHAFVEDLTRGMAASGDPDRFGEDVSVTFGINPDAG